MAQNPFSRLAALGEDVLEKASQNPAAAKLVTPVLQLKERTDDLARRVRGLEAMERRIEQLEKRLAKLEGEAKPRSSKTEPKSSSSTKS